MDILELVEHYRRNRESYTSAQYNETQLRRESKMGNMQGRIKYSTLESFAVPTPDGVRCEK